MKDYEPLLSFEEANAAVYDANDGTRGDEASTVEFLASKAGGGRALELAVGTGRIALPLSAAGVPVDGVDFSEPMLARLRAKPGGDRLRTVVGDFADVPVDGTYSLVYLVYNTLYNLLTQDDQVRCFDNVARHLTPDGVFVVEAFTPGYLHRLRDSQYVDTQRVEGHRVTLDVGRHDAVNQLLDESHIDLTAAGGVRLTPIVCRYVWPSELDLMARLAGLRLVERWQDWTRTPFTGDSKAHVSVYGRQG